MYRYNQNYYNDHYFDDYSMKERNLNRENLLNFLVLCSYNSKSSDKAIEEDNFLKQLDDNIEFKLSQLIENNLRNKINQFNGSILLKCVYAIFLYDYQFKYNKAFFTILSLHEDISQGLHTRIFKVFSRICPVSVCCIGKKMMSC